ncbi:hypothetical protein RUND412_009699 [Rhizina undulata]
MKPNTEKANGFRPRGSIIDPLRRPKSTTRAGVKKPTQQTRASSSPAAIAAARALSNSPVRTTDVPVREKSFSVVIPVRTKPSLLPHSVPPPNGMPAGSAATGPVQALASDSSKATGRDVNRLVDKAHTELRNLFYLRNEIQKINADVEVHGPGFLDMDKVKRLKWVLTGLAYHRFLNNDYDVSKIGKAVSLLARPELYGDDVSDMAKKLIGRWKLKNFAPGSINAELDEFDESDEEEEEGEAAPQAESNATSSAGANLLRGIIVERGKKISRVFKLDPKYPKKPADRFGANGLNIGDWWPYQICALRDGAHGSRMGGIHGRIADGAFSIVVSGAYDDNDRDRGDVIYYSGSRGGEEDKLRHETSSDPNPGAILSRSTKSLIVSYSTQKPVRVLRSFQCNSRWSPSAGIRYDGLYKVLSYSQEQNRSGERYYQFELRREPGQPPIDQSRPTPLEIRATERLRGY